MGKVAFHGGVWKKKDLDKEYLKVKDAIYVSPTKDGAYLGTHSPNKSGKEINTLLEIYYSNPNFLRDYRKDSTNLGQEGLWIGKKFRLKKIKDTMIKIPKRFRYKKPLRYRHIVAEIDEKNSERTPTYDEYQEVLREFMNKYNKQCKPDYLNEEEKKFFYDSIQKKVGTIKDMDLLKEKPESLEGIIKTSSIIFFIVGALFLSSSLTGNVIGNLSIKNHSIIGAVIFIVALFLSLFLIKQKKKNLYLPKGRYN